MSGTRDYKSVCAIVTIASLLMVCFFVGCAEKKGTPKSFLVVLPDREGHYRPEIVTLTTLPSVEKLEGEAAQVFFNATLTDAGFEGSVAKPRFTQINNVYVPEDVESSLLITVYAHFEWLYFWEKKAFSAPVLKWPRSVGVLTKAPSGEIGRNFHNNARYFHRSDSILITPYLMSEVPMAVNPGILAHEHFHAYFQKQFMTSLVQYLKNESQVLDPIHWMASFWYSGILGETGPENRRDNEELLKKAFPENSSLMILRAWNEGLADYMGFVYSQHPNFVKSSYSRILSARSLVGSGSVLPSRETLSKAAFGGNFQIFPDCACSGVQCAYCAGTLLARLFYQLQKDGPPASKGGQDHLAAPDAWLAHVLIELPKLSQRLVQSQNSEDFHLDMIIDLMLPPNQTLSSDSCQFLKTLMRARFSEERYPTCPK